LTGGRDGLGKIWDAKSGKLLATLDSQKHIPVQRVAISPDGGRIALADQEGNVSLWKLAPAPQETRTFRFSAPWVLRFTADGKRIVVAGMPGVRLAPVDAGGAETDIATA
jgi:WD40 repeat protein